MNEKEFYKLHHKQIYYPEHPYCGKNGYIVKHRLEVEEIIGRYLMPKEVVHHHYNKDGSATLVLCPNQTYHSLLHLREEALKACGNTNWKRCKFCKQYDDPKSMVISKHTSYHQECLRDYKMNRS